MPEREGDSRIGPRTQSGGIGGEVGVPPRPSPPPATFQILALVAAIAGVIAGLLGYDSVLLIFCGLSAVFIAISLLVKQTGGIGGEVGVPPKPPPPPPPEDRPPLQ